MRKVEVVPHNPAWKMIFQTEASLVKEALGETVMAVHHIGSTAIPDIHAKPIIDLLDLLHNWICDMVLNLMLFLFSAIPHELRSSPKAECKRL